MRSNVHIILKHFTGLLCMRMNDLDATFWEHEALRLITCNDLEGASRLRDVVASLQVDLQDEFTANNISLIVFY